MNIDFHSPRFALPPALTDHARRRVQLTLMHRSESIQSIVTWIGGTNGRRSRTQSSMPDDLDPVGINCRTASRPVELPRVDGN